MKRESKKQRSCSCCKNVDCRGEVMDLAIILTLIATTVTTIGFVYGFLRNFKADIHLHIDKLEKRMDTLEERMFWMATGKKLEDAILEEKMKRSRTDS